jgi:hypothetical protein
MLARFSMWRTMQRRVDLQAGVQTGQSVVLGRELDVWCQAEKLSSWVQFLPGRRERALVAAGLELGAAATTSGQVAGALSVGSPAALKASLVEIEDGGRAVEREAQHLAVGLAV